MNLQLLGDILSQVIYVAPICVLIYKVGKFTTEQEHLKQRVDQMEQDYGISISNETIRYQELFNKVSEVVNTVTRIETKLEERTSKARTEQ